MDESSDSTEQSEEEEVGGSPSLEFAVQYEWKHPPAVHKTYADHHNITYCDAFEDTVLECAPGSMEDYGHEANDDDDGALEASEDVAASMDVFPVSSDAQPVNVDQPAEDWDAEIDSTHPYGMPVPYVHKRHDPPSGNAFTYGKATNRLFRHLRFKKPDAPDICEGQFDDA